ncbi:MAG: 8-oxo-dGTP diphosphatase MutT [Halieaceae bacterium]|nr:8-oxo-dGTP diphosphatase MutT [Halieaceae bacterium]
MLKVVTVAVGILIDPQGRVLITRRAPQTHQGGLWEFPGGKVEPGETIVDALARELKEELGVTVLISEPFMTLDHDYGDQCVCLAVHRVTSWRGEPSGMEGQPLAWEQPANLTDWPFPAANQPILTRLLTD